MLNLALIAPLVASVEVTDIQGPAFQSRPMFKLFHNDYASSGIWTVGSTCMRNMPLMINTALLTP